MNRRHDRASSARSRQGEEGLGREVCPILFGHMLGCMHDLHAFQCCTENTKFRRIVHVSGSQAVANKALIQLPYCKGFFYMNYCDFNQATKTDLHAPIISHIFRNSKFIMHKGLLASPRGALSWPNRTPAFHQQWKSSIFFLQLACVLSGRMDGGLLSQ